MDRVPQLLVAALVLLAGCGGAARDAPPVTPAPVPTRTAPGADTGTVSAPLDLNRSAALAAAHERALNGSSYTVRRTVTVERPDGTIVRRVTTTARLAANRSRFYAARSIVEPGRTTSGEFWSDGERLLRALTYGDSTIYLAVPARLYEPRDRRVVRPASSGDEIDAVFGAVDVRVVDRLARNVPGESGDAAEAYYAISGRGPGLTGRLDPAVGTAPRNVTLRAIVGSSGIVYQFRLSYTVTVDGGTARVTRTVRYVGIGTTRVGRPPWYDEAVANTTGDGPSMSP